MPARYLKATTMDPAQHTVPQRPDPAAIELPNEEFERATALVETLGWRPELRFDYIQKTPASPAISTFKNSPCHPFAPIINCIANLSAAAPAAGLEWGIAYRLNYPSPSAPARTVPRLRRRRSKGAGRDWSGICSANSAILRIG